MRNNIFTHAVRSNGSKFLATLMGGLVLLGVVGSLWLAQPTPSVSSHSQLQMADGDDIKRT